jgi:hypothetical protein
MIKYGHTIEVSDQCFFPCMEGLAWTITQLELNQIGHSQTTTRTFRERRGSCIYECGFCFASKYGVFVTSYSFEVEQQKHSTHPTYNILQVLLFIMRYLVLASMLISQGKQGVYPTKALFFLP